MKRRSRSWPSTTHAVMAVLALASSVSGQSIEVRYDHQPQGPRADRVWHVDANGIRRPGSPRDVDVPVGGRLCWLVENPNPLLYDYSLQTEEVEQDVDLSVLVGSLADVMKAAMPGFAPALAGVAGQGLTDSVAKEFAARLPPGTGPQADTALTRLIDKTVAMVLSSDALAARVGALDSLRLRSDSIRSFDEVLDRAEGMHSATMKHRASLNTLMDDQKRAAEDPHVPEAERHAFDLIREEVLRSADLAVRQSGELMKTFRTAAGSIVRNPDTGSSLGVRLCKTVEGAGTVAVQLFVKRKSAAGGVARITSEEPVATYQADVVNPSRVDVGVSYWLAGAFDGARSFFLQNDTIRDEPSDDVIGRLAVTAQFQATGPLWIMLSTAKGTDVGPDLFAGLSVRGGVAGANAALGVGAVFAQMPAALKTGKVGQPLPEGQTKLSDLIDYRYRLGLGVSISITGLDLGGSGSGAEQKKRSNQGS